MRGKTVDGIPLPHLLIVQDDPDDGPSVGPPPDKGGFDPALGIQAVVIWSGAWNQHTWKAITDTVIKRDIRTMIVLTQEQHHNAWRACVPLNIPLLEIKP